ncbi:DUF3306 domain-containing protein [Polaromonas sp. JS666]|uniref:DUF3306 domain-containing protein n=1 Tax=Polaromonas sp. (strain JS666 / ATCC BAA-500) TaxID=296591 RepID=UPI0000463F88|nr:DUF3306 domain-containing protein [Polaromonas sp. JS666]ABE42889.1 conserved hypothetical protein [Polaromonas sp. JS666]
MTEERGGFLGRWARRKSDALQGKPLEEPAPVATPAVGAGAILPPGQPEAAPVAAPTPAGGAEPAEKELSLDDVRLLTKDSDFKPFMAEGVGPDVRNAAMKKLFADPHFNVMDGLDIYIDDYSISEPIPESMLRQMASAKFLKLFDDEEDDQGEQDDPEKIQAAVARESANNPEAETVAQSPEDTGMPIPDSVNPDNRSQAGSLPDTGASQRPDDHAHTDLRLQPDHAPPAPGGGRGTQ